nr:hypothetical protein [Tanacetum cinerariifolium]
HRVPGFAGEGGGVVVGVGGMEEWSRKPGRWELQSLSSNEITSQLSFNHLAIPKARLDDEEDTRSSHKYLNNLEEEYQGRALLAKSKAVTVKNKGLIAEAYEWDEEEVSSDDNEMVEIKVLMALAEDNDSISKEGARNGEWVKISIRKFLSSPLPKMVWGISRATCDILIPLRYGRYKEHANLRRPWQLKGIGLMTEKGNRQGTMVAGFHRVRELKIKKMTIGREDVSGTAMIVFVIDDVQALEEINCAYQGDEPDS